MRTNTRIMYNNFGSEQDFLFSECLFAQNLFIQKVQLLAVQPTSMLI